MATRLGEHFGCPVVPEQLRLFVDQKGSLPAYEDFRVIEEMHHAAERLALVEARRSRSPLYVTDADTLSLDVFWRYVFGKSPARSAPVRIPDLYLLMGDDIPWVADPGQRDGPEARAATQPMFREALQSQRLPFAEIVGTEPERFNAAVAAIENL